MVTTVDKKNIENIELVSEKAKAGYKSGYSDPEFIKELPTFQLPFLSSNKKYRAFQISGDSMLPIPDKSWIIGEFIEDWLSIKDGQLFILLTLEDGIVFKTVYNQIRLKNTLLLKSLNPIYKSYEITLSEVKEVWKFVQYISSEIPETAILEDNLVSIVLKHDKDINQIKEKLNMK